ncbi:Hypothetical predicted protein [Cloeon dipterum]|uniref:Uncharacterized protein n=1 Tax=Cloeon dipterum TaxID=197152 RepID=A0A8S1D673_9INSE|nr:Hypothetical predicted protein [Cloeon dipterum]
MDLWFHVKKNGLLMDQPEEITAKNSILVARVSHQGHVLPGYVQVAEKLCYFVYEDEVLVKDEFQLLQNGQHLKWKLHKAGNALPGNAFVAGWSCWQQEFFCYGVVSVNGVPLGGLVRGDNVLSVATKFGIIEAKTFFILLIDSSLVPEDACYAVPAGRVGNSLTYAARAWHENNLLPGHMMDGIAYVIYDDRVVKKTEYQVLCGRPLLRGLTRMEDADIMMPEALQAGHTDKGEPLFLGFDSRQQVTGQVRGGVCYVTTVASFCRVVRCLNYWLYTKTYANQQKLALNLKFD